MALELKRKDVLENYNTYKVCYCDLQGLLHYENNIGFTCGIYGWNCDIYIFEIKNRFVAISTGYRPFGNEINYKIIEDYEKKAREIINNFHLTYEVRKEKVKKLLNDFLEKIIQ